MSSRTLQLVEGGGELPTCSRGLDVWDAWSFFKLLDEDGGGEVEVEEPTWKTMAMESKTCGVRIFKGDLPIHGFRRFSQEGQVRALPIRIIHTHVTHVFLGAAHLLTSSHRRTPLKPKKACLAPFGSCEIASELGRACCFSRRQVSRSVGRTVRLGGREPLPLVDRSS